MIILQRQCDWCDAIENIPTPENQVTWYQVNIGHYPLNWRTTRNPLEPGNIDVCPKCHNQIAASLVEATTKAEELRLKILMDSKPRKPRLESDARMREKERNKTMETM